MIMTQIWTQSRTVHRETLILLEMTLALFLTQKVEEPLRRL